MNEHKERAKQIDINQAKDSENILYIGHNAIFVVFYPQQERQRNSIPFQNWMPIFWVFVDQYKVPTSD